MLEISIGDYIVIPKASHSNKIDINHKFIILEAIGTYSFIDTKRYGDYGHMIPVKIIGTCHYDFNSDSINIASKFGFPFEKCVETIREFENKISNYL